MLDNYLLVTITNFNQLVQDAVKAAVHGDLDEAFDEIAKRHGHEGDVQYLELKVKRDADMQVSMQEVARPGGSHKFKKPVDPILDFISIDGGIIYFFQVPGGLLDSSHAGDLLGL